MSSEFSLPPRDKWLAWTVVPLRRYADFQGRSAPLEFWMYSVFLAAGYAAIGVMSGVIGALAEMDTPAGLMVIGWTLFFFANFVPGLALSVRRLHDLDFAGSWMWAAYGAMMIFSFLAWFAYLAIMSIPGKPVPNRFGEPAYRENLDQVFG